MSHRSLLVVALVLAGCEATGPVVAPPPPQPGAAVTLRTEFPSYGPDTGVINLRLSNQGSGRIGYNLCHSTLERLQGQGWSEVRPADPRVCTMELRMLGPGEQTVYPYDVRVRLESGQYRFRTSVHDMGPGTREPLVSNAFAVTPRGPVGR